MEVLEAYVASALDLIRTSVRRRPGVCASREQEKQDSSAAEYCREAVHLHLAFLVSSPARLTFQDGTVAWPTWSVLAYRYLPALEEQVVLAVHDGEKGIYRGPSPSPSPTTTGSSGTCPSTAPATAPGGFSADVQGSHVVLSPNAVATATEYEVMMYLPDGDMRRDNIVTTTSATYDVVPATGTYTYQVRAVNSVNSGPWSGTESFTVTQ
jgi:hypothetical protein